MSFVNDNKLWRSGEGSDWQTDLERRKRCYCFARAARYLSQCKSVSVRASGRRSDSNAPTKSLLLASPSNSTGISLLLSVGPTGRVSGGLMEYRALGSLQMGLATKMTLLAGRTCRSTTTKLRRRLEENSGTVFIRVQVIYLKATLSKVLEEVKGLQTLRSSARKWIVSISSISGS